MLFKCLIHCIYPKCKTSNIHVLYPPRKQRLLSVCNNNPNELVLHVQNVSWVSSVQSLSRVWLFATRWTAAHQASLSITNFRSLLKLMSIKSVMPSNHLILCCPLLLPPSIFPSIRVFSNDLCIRWPKYWSFRFSISSSNEYSGLISFGMDCVS